ncbi:MAG: matrixin family metalloprotease [Candidatus Doudnabacteria bacterium]|nr:matrixin family metalloprotease [bacterium]MDZ4243576.1 matrixin family metalloprotease [Candidatus Doudnabacteria bacterium]
MLKNRKFFVKFLTPTALVLLLTASSAGAVPNLSNASLATPETQRTLLLPAAADNSPVISLGSAVDPQTGLRVEGIAFIHRKNNSAKPGGQNAGATRTSCFSYLAKDAKWKAVEPWLVNPDNTRGLGSDFVFDNLTADIEKWEDAADGLLGNGTGANILGSGFTATTTLSADTAAPDGQNEVYFADVSSAGAIAVTIVWGIFSGPPSGRQLVEWDMVFDDTDYDWSASGEAGKMDFENIATHELGHAVGFGHPSDSCVEETMYRYADYGETKKRDLNAGDIAGANKLY